MDMYERLNLDVKRSEGKIGIEIEVEGRNLPVVGGVWRTENDGSLKTEEAYEYVLRKPTDLEGVEEALDHLQQEFEDAEAENFEGVRAGIHVHLNIQTYTPTELLTLVTTYYILEDLFVGWCGKTRVGNHFCLRATDAEFVINKLLAACQKKDWRQLNTEDIRYTSLNLTSMFKYGSIEFRSMRSTADHQQILKWVKLILQLEQGAKRFANPRDVIHAMSMGGPKDFIRTVMGDMAREFDNINSNIIESMRVVQPVAFMVDWERFNKAKVNPFL